MFQVLENSFTNYWIFQVWETCLIQYAHSCKLTLSLINIHVLESSEILIKIRTEYSFMITIMQRLTRRVSVIKMRNRRRGGHVDLRLAVSVIKRSEFFLQVFAVT